MTTEDRYLEMLTDLTDKYAQDKITEINAAGKASDEQQPIRFLGENQESVVVMKECALAVLHPKNDTIITFFKNMICVTACKVSVQN